MKIVLLLSLFTVGCSTAHLSDKDGWIYTRSMGHDTIYLCERDVVNNKNVPICKEANMLSRHAVGRYAAQTNPKDAQAEAGTECTVVNNKMTGTTVTTCKDKN